MKHRLSAENQREGHAEPRIIGVLGMHRSGTSCLMWALEQSGVCVGPVVAQGLETSLGYRENDDIWRLHERLLKSNGGDWKNPPERVLWETRHKKQRDKIVRKHFSSHPLWGFKDPRLLFTIEGWLEAFPNMEWVGTFRHPLAVAASLAARDGMSRSEALRTWCCYNEKLLRIHSQYGPFPLISFDLPEAEYVDCVNALLESLHLTAGARFFEASFRHHDNVPGSVLPQQCEQIYERLLDLVDCGVLRGCVAPELAGT